MGRCKVPPYEGEKSFIFISYSHQDENTVYPILEALSHYGYRIWYDEGIEVGSEWPEMIANHMGRCSAVIAFITNHSINSHNCRREVNFALMKQKPVVSIVLEPVTLSLGMEMQLSTTQAIFKYQILDEKVFYAKLLAASSLQTCKSMPEENDMNVPAVDRSEKKKIEQEIVDNTPPSEDLTPSPCFLVQVKSKERYEILPGENTMGSSVECQIRLDSQYISKKHAVLVLTEKGLFIKDLESKNGVLLEGKRIHNESFEKLHSGSEIQMADVKLRVEMEY